MTVSSVGGLAVQWSVRRAVLGRYKRMLRCEDFASQLNERNRRSGRIETTREFCHLLLEDVTSTPNNTSESEEPCSTQGEVMADLLGLKGQMLPQDKMWMALGVIGVVFAIGVLAWIIHTLRTLFREDEGSAGGVHDFLGQLRESQSEGDVTPEEFRSIQRRLVEQSMGTGDSTRKSRATPAKSADPPTPIPLVPYQDDADDHSP